MIYKTDEAAQRACVKWQKILRLKDWEVVAQIRRMVDFKNKPHAWAEIDYSRTRKQAVVFLLDPCDFAHSNAHCFPQDHEQSLVHELLHLHTAWWSSSPNTEERDLEEQMIEALAFAFVEIARK